MGSDCMNKIEEAYRLAASVRRKFIMAAFGGFVIISGLELLDQKSGNKFNTSVIFGFFIFYLFLFIFIINTPSVKGCFIGSLLYKSLEKLGYANEFVKTIDYEVKNDLIIDYHNEDYKISFFVTKTWFVYISPSSSVIRKLSEISTVSRKIKTSRRRKIERNILHIDFTDGSYFTELFSFASDEIFELFKEEFPSYTC